MNNIRKILVRIIYPKLLREITDLKIQYNDTHKQLMLQQKINKEIKNRNIELKTVIKKYDR